ncbi:hypothetical protein A2W24_00045 [Microgenomates group bacterium RBG_16_45_19]|nr:MAG: hypothetical protein A2W24_00045 [Microgenomates group bacterium RBG_16_45_19]
MAEPGELDLLKDEYWIVGWPVFALHSDRFPYLVYRLAGGIYSLVTVPKKIKDKLAMLEWVQMQSLKYKYQACLVFSAKQAYYFNAPGKIEETRIPAMGGTIVNWDKLRSGEIKEKVMEGKLKVYATDNPKSELPNVTSTGMRIAFEGVEPLVAAN